MAGMICQVECETVQCSRMTWMLWRTQPQLQPDSLCPVPAWLAARLDLPVALPLPPLLLHVTVTPRLPEPASELALHHTVTINRNLCCDLSY